MAPRNASSRKKKKAPSPELSSSEDESGGEESEIEVVEEVLEEEEESEEEEEEQAKERPFKEWWDERYGYCSDGDRSLFFEAHRDEFDGLMIPQFGYHRHIYWLTERNMKYVHEFFVEFNTIHRENRVITEHTVNLTGLVINIPGRLVFCDVKQIAFWAAWWAGRATIPDREFTPAEMATCRARWEMERFGRLITPYQPEIEGPRTTATQDLDPKIDATTPSTVTPDSSPSDARTTAAVGQEQPDTPDAPGVAVTRSGYRLRPRNTLALPVRYRD